MTLNITIEHLEALSSFFLGKGGIRGDLDFQKFSSVDILLDHHFSMIGVSESPTRRTVERALRMLEEQPALIVETGASAWGIDSTTLFDKYVHSFGGELLTVDIRVEPLYSLPRRCSKSTTVFCNDSLKFLSRLPSNRKVDLFYLDSFDLDPTNPLPSVMHGLHEFFLILPILNRYGGLLLVDDTPRMLSDWIEVQGATHLDQFQEFIANFGFLPGKGALIREYVTTHDCGAIISDGYQLLVSFNPT